MFLKIRLLNSSRSTSGISISLSFDHNIGGLAGENLFHRHRTL